MHCIVSIEYQKVIFCNSSEMTMISFTVYILVSKLICLCTLKTNNQNNLRQHFRLFNYFLSAIFFKNFILPIFFGLFLCHRHTVFCISHQIWSAGNSVYSWIQRTDCKSILHWCRVALKIWWYLMSFLIYVVFDFFFIKYKSISWNHFGVLHFRYIFSMFRNV